MENRMADDPAQQKKPEACSFVIFGVTGDLAHRLILPALYNLASKELLPDDFCVVGIARKAMSNDELCTSLLRGLHEFATRPVDDAVARRLPAPADRRIFSGRRRDKFGLTKVR
jgi:glucose-6-phosphate 1-dehydrogenase